MSLLARAADVLEYTWKHPANRGRRGRAVVAVARFQVLGRLLGRPAIARVGDHSVIRADVRAYHAARAMYANPLDWNEMTTWRRTLRPGSLFVDVGANVGLYTIWALDIGAEVIAIEPDRRSCERLAENLTLNGYAATIVQAAAGESAGALRLTTGLDNQNHLVLGSDASTVPSATVPVQTLDAIVGDRVVDGLKIDVEGAELLVLRGARRLLSSQRARLIQLEWNRASLDLLGEERASTAAFLRSYGYELCRPDARGELTPLGDLGFGPDVFARPAPTRSEPRG